MKRIYYFPTLLLAVVSAALFFGSCRKDKFTDIDTPIYPPPAILVECSVTGLVADEDGKPVATADVYLGTKHTLTNEQGIFHIEGQANSVLPLIRVEKTGYFPSLASYSVRAGGNGRVKVTLRAKSPAVQISSVLGGTASFGNGVVIDFEPNGFVDAAGQPYTGVVHVQATYLDPSKPEVGNMIPGGFLGLNAVGENQMLTSFGMLHVLLQTLSGEKLQISKPATVTMPIPTDRAAQSPATIPLWYLDEASGYWKEEGSAKRIGNTYTGKVSHFSWWNCDIGSGYVRMNGRIRLGSEHPFVVLRVTQNSGLSATTTPDAEGYFSGGVPANETFLFEVLNECGDVVYSVTLGPYSSETDIGIISVTWSSNWFEVTGSLVDCNQQPVTNGFVSFNTNGNSSPAYFPIAVDPVTGTFTGSVVNCAATEVTLFGLDLDASLQSDPVTLPISADVDFGAVEVCDNPITLGMTLEFPNGTKKFIPINSATMQSDSSVGDFYRFIATDNQGGNSAEYTIIFLNWTGNPNNPLWSSTTSYQVTGSPVYYEFEVPSNSIQALALGSQPGEQVIFRLSNIIVNEVPAGLHFGQCNVTLSAILQ
ncbi:MAG: hypothetical protein ABMA02_10735 [Saprospiraceae bacterium]